MALESFIRRWVRFPGWEKRRDIVHTIDELLNARPVFG